MRQKPRKRAEPMQLGTFIDVALPGRAAPEEAQLLLVTAWWSKHVPIRIVRNARPVKIVRGMLLVHTTSSTWAGELSFQADEWLAKLRNALPDIPLRTLRVQVGAMPEIDLPRPIDADDVKAPLRPLQALPESLARELTRVQDDDLRSAIDAAAKKALGTRDRKRR